MTTVKSGSNPLAGAAVSVQVRNPGGSMTTLSATTSTNGVATVSYPIRSTSAAGTYSVTSTATMGSVTRSASASFAVQ